MTSRVLVLGTAAASPLAAMLDGELVLVPDLVFDDGWSGAGALEAWRRDAAAGSRSEQVVVAAWSDVPTRRDLVELGLDGWIAGFEAPFARWFAALGAAVLRCDDGGAVVALVDRPVPLDAAGFGPESAVADAVEVLVRSLAKAHGPRGVRVTTVTTPARMTVPPFVAPPLLDRPPGALEDAAAAVRLLLSDGAAALTGTTVHADLGRSWR